MLYAVSVSQHHYLYCFSLSCLCSDSSNLRKLSSGNESVVVLHCKKHCGSPNETALYRDEFAYDKRFGIRNDGVDQVCGVVKSQRLFAAGFVRVSKNSINKDATKRLGRVAKANEKTGKSFRQFQINSSVTMMDSWFGTMVRWCEGQSLAKAKNKIKVCKHGRKNECRRWANAKKNAKVCK